jgi:hypothetical protein
MKDNSAPQACPECGASEDCAAYFHECLVKEYIDPAYGAVHHLTVPTYMLQHPGQLSQRGWLEMRNLLVQFCLEGKSPATIRKQNRHRLDSRQRDFSFRKGEPIQLPGLVWSKTIAEVDLTDPTRYCAEVKAWAQVVLADIDTFFKQQPSDEYS